MIRSDIAAAFASSVSRASVGLVAAAWLASPCAAADGRRAVGRRALPHTNVVRDLVLLGRWTGAPQSLSVPRAPDGLRTAVLVQGRAGGPILASASD